MSDRGRVFGGNYIKYAFTAAVSRYSPKKFTALDTQILLLYNNNTHKIKKFNKRG